MQNREQYLVWITNYPRYGCISTEACAHCRVTEGRMTVEAILLGELFQWKNTSTWHNMLILCHFYSWCYAYLLQGERFYTTGLAAVCWVMWNCRNRATFEFKKLASPFEIVFAASVHLSYWAGLLKGGDRTDLERGVALLKENTKSMMRICASSYTNGTLEWRSGWRCDLLLPCCVDCLNL